MQTIKAPRLPVQRSSDVRPGPGKGCAHCAHPLFWRSRQPEFLAWDHVLGNQGGAILQLYLAGGNAHDEIEAFVGTEVVAVPGIGRHRT
jgi:hypothetical protein